MLKDYRLTPANGNKPEHAVIFLHGLGDSGAGGLLSIGQIWQNELPDCVFLCPDAPFAFENAPLDFGGRQWFSLTTFAPDAVLAGVKKAVPYLNKYIDHVMQTYQLAADKITLVGFSQGTIMALYVAPRRKEPLACVLGYSGLLIGGESLSHEKVSSFPIFLVHGKRDEVVPFSSLEFAERSLKNAGFSVTTLICPETGHTIDEAGLMAGLSFIKHNSGG